MWARQLVILWATMPWNNLSWYILWGMISSVQKIVYTFSKSVQQTHCEALTTSEKIKKAQVDTYSLENR